MNRLQSDAEVFAPGAAGQSQLVLLTDEEVFGTGQAGDSELLSDDFVFGSRELPAGVTPSEGRSASPMGQADPRLVREPRRGGMRAEMTPYVAQGKPDDSTIASGPLADATLQRTRRETADPMLRPEFIDQVRAEFEAVPLAQRLPRLQQLAGGSDVRARAARQILRDVQAENTATGNTAARQPVASTIMADVKPAVGAGAPGGVRRPAMPQVGTLDQIARGETGGQTLRRDAGARAVTQADQSPLAFAQRAAAEQRDYEMEAFSAENPMLGALGSGAARQLRGAANIAPMVMDFAARLASIDTEGTNFEGETSAKLRRMANSLMPEVGRQSMSDAWDKGEFGGWLTTNLIAQAPQIAQSVVAAFVPGAQGVALATMGASAAGNKFADTGSSAAAVVSGGIEVGSEMIPLEVLHRTFAALKNLPPARQGEVLQAIGAALPKVGVALGANAIAGAIEESAAQVGNNMLDMARGERKSIFDGVADAAVIGAFASGAMSGPKAVGVLAQAAQSPGSAIAKAMDENVANTFFRQDAIDSFARPAATDPNFSDPTFIDPAMTTRAPGAVGPAAPIRVEDMPETPMAPEQAAAMVQAGQEARFQAEIEQAIQQQAERQQPTVTQDQQPPFDEDRVDGRRPAGTSNQDDLRAADGQPGTIARGSLAAAARRQLDANDGDTAQISETTKPTGMDGLAPAPSTRAGTEQPSAQLPARLELTATPRPVEVAGEPTRSGSADSGGRAREPGAPARPTDGPSYASRDKAFVAAVEAGMSTRMDPVRGADGRWRLRERPQPANAIDPAPPSAAPGRTADAQTATRLAPAALTNAPPSAAQAEAPSESSGNPSSLQTLSMGALHVDPGRAPELATPGVAVNSLQRASISTGHRPADLRADLVAQIDIAVATAKPDSDADVLAHAEAMARRGSTEPGASQRAEQAARRVGYVTFDVPGDGQFTVLNSAGRLASFKRLVQQSAGFKDGSAGTVSKARGAQLGSPTTKTAIEAMIDDGDPQAALDYATAKQIPVEAVGLSPRRLAALSGLVATGAAETAAGLPADGASPGDRVRQGAGDGQAEPPAARSKGALRAAADGSPAIEGRLIADAGEKIGGARKDRWAEQGLSLSDLDGMTESEGAQLVTKAAVWRPDFTGMVAAGSHPTAVAMVKLVVDSLAAKPKDNTPAGRRRYVVAMQAVRRAYSDLGQYGQGLHGIEPMARQVLQRAAEKLRNDLNVSGSDAAAQREARAVLFSVYKGRSDPFSPGYSVEQRAAKLVADGFPAKAEPWTRRLEIKAIGGAGLTEAGARAYQQLAAELAVDLSADQLRAGAFAVAAKGKPRPVAIAATRADAEAAAQALYATELQAHADSKVAPERPHLDVLQRDGLAPRIERDVTPDDLLQTFGFRGTEFGNWTAQDERQKMLNLAFDGLSDLAEILGVPPAALSLNGTLGLAFGARGGGRFAAHYEPGKLVINLTKLQGGGSLAHEWAHSVDHYLGELDRTDAYQTGARGASGWRDRRDYTGKPQRRMVQEGGRWAMREERPLSNLRPELASAVDKVMRGLYEKALPQAEAVREAELRVEQLQARQAQAEMTENAELSANYDSSLKDAQRRLADARAGLHQGSIATDFARQAQQLSGKQANGYWQRPTEMFARAFESFVFDRLVAMGARSQYLVHGVESDRFAGPSFKGNPYPVGEERAAVNAAFGELVNTLQTRTTDQGVALFQRRGQSPALAAPSRDPAELNALRALRENDDLFALPRSGGRTVDEITADIAPQIKVRTTHVSSQETMHRLTLPDGSFALVIERKASPLWPGVYGFEMVGGEEVPITTRPGENPEDVPPETSDVYVDASNLHSGGGGARVYAIASALAHNTGAVFIGDPAGLSDEAMRRRPEQMLSSALKYGTTQHLAPHQRQVVGDASLGVAPLRWVYGDDLGNIRRLVDVNLAALQNAGLNDINFDPASGHFTDAAGHEIGRGGIGARVAAGAGRGALAGRSTLARGAVLRALVREEGAALAGENGRRDGLLARIAGLGDDPALAGIFYDRSGASPEPVADPGRLRMVRAAVEQVTATWKNSPAIEVLASMQDAPEPARRVNSRQLAAGALGSPAAFYYGGKVYVLASQMSGAREVAESVAHEALGHFGLRGTFGPDLGKALDELAVWREADVRAKATEYGLDYADKAQRQQAAEEVLAELAQSQPELPLVQRAIAAIRAWLRKNIPMLAELPLSDGEIVARFILPARTFVVDGAARAAANQSVDVSAFARRSMSGERGDSHTPMSGFRDWLEKAGPDAGASVRFTDTVDAITETGTATPAPRGALADTVEVDGQPRPSRNSAGQPLGVDEEAVRDFWRRFAGSAVVDATGRPQLVYHGLVDGSRRAFKVKADGQLGAGLYFRDRPADARADDAADQIEAGSWKPGAAASYVVLRNPYVFDQASFTWPDGQPLPGKPASPIAKLLVDLLPEPKAGQALRKLRTIPGVAPKAGTSLRDTLRGMGHDGLVVRFADPSQGAPAYVAFDREQGIRAWQSPGPMLAPTTAATAAAKIEPRATLPDAIDVDGRQRPTTNADGRPIAGSTDAVANFWRWLGDSKAIDSHGRPIVLMHGTGRDIHAFKPSRAGLFGAGIYLAGSTESANQYATLYNEEGGGLVMQVYARLRNPYHLVTELGWLPSWYGKPTDSYFTHPDDYPLGIKLLAEVLPRNSASRIIDRLMREGTINAGDAVTRRLKELGHDGIVVTEGFGNPARTLDDAAWREFETEVVVFNPKDIKSASGNDGAFSSAKSDLRFQRKVRPEDQPAKDFSLRPFGRAGRAVELVQDRYNRWKQAIEDVRGQGGNISDENDFYRAEERHWGRIGSGIESFKDELGGFVDAVKRDGLRIEDVALYAYAQHAAERNKWVSESRSSDIDAGSGMANSEAEGIMQAAREAGAEAQLRRHAGTLRQWIQGTRDLLLDAGLIDQAEHASWRAMFTHYVPLRGFLGEADQAGGAAKTAARSRPAGIRGNESERATGRSTQAMQIIETIAHDRSRALIRAGRNDVLRSFARFVLDNPSPGLWQVKAVESRAQPTTDEDGHLALAENEGVVKDGRSIVLKDGGDEIHIVVHDRDLLEQLQRLTLDERPSFAVGALLSANRWLSRVYTSLSPVFTAMNAIRDTQAAAFGMIDEIGFIGAPKLFAALPSAWAESFRAEAGKTSADYASFKAMGGVTHFYGLTTIDHQAEQLAAMVKDADRSPLNPRKFLPKALDLIERINGGIENATRLAAFKVARDSGKSTVQAASIAKNITVNFNRKGTQQLASAWVLFFNPAVQGTARIGQAMTNPKVLATLGTAMVGVAMLALRSAAMGEDDDGVAWWDKIPDEIKERNLVIMLPPGSSKGERVPGSLIGRYVKIPMPYGYNFFAVVANQVVDVWRHSQDPRRGRDAVRAGGKAFGAFTSSWLPSQDLGRALTADDAESAGKSAVLLLVPDAIDPLARIGINQDAFGRPLRPDSRFIKGQPDSSTYFSGQHGNLFQRGAADLNQLTGGSRFREGAVDVAPSTLEHLARSYGGGPVGFGLDIMNAIYLRQTISRPELDASRLPFVKQFVGSIDDETDRMAGYQRLDMTERLINPIQAARRAGDGKEARALHEIAGPIAGLGDAVLQTRQRIGEIVKRERSVIDSTVLSDDAKFVKLVELAARKRKALQAFNKAYDRAVAASIRQEPED